jgi:hypothetical protein
MFGHCPSIIPLCPPSLADERHVFAENRQAATEMAKHVSMWGKRRSPEGPTKPLLVSCTNQGVGAEIREEAS